MHSAAIVRPLIPTEVEFYAQYGRDGELLDPTETLRSFKCAVPCLGYSSANDTALSSEHWGAPPSY